MKLCKGIPHFEHEEICYDSGVCPACKALDQFAAAGVNAITKSDECKILKEELLKKKSEWLACSALNDNYEAQIELLEEKIIELGDRVTGLGGVL